MVNIIQKCAFYIFQLRIMYLLKLEYNVPLKRNSWAIAEPLVCL